MSVRTILILWLTIFPIHHGLGQYPHIIINEFLASNSSINIDPDFSSFTDWVELYNLENHDVDISGYSLTDNFNAPDKWQFPSGTIISGGDYLLVWTDGTDSLGHTSFKLSKAGEEIGLYDFNGNLIDSISFAGQISDVSYGRDIDGSDLWLNFGEPTPGLPNLTWGSLTQRFVQSPSFALPGGDYSGIQELILSASQEGVEIRYTLDGSTPTSESAAYQNPITINHTTVVRARSFHPDYISKEIITHTYFIDDSSTLPVISLTTNPEYLWNHDVGIFINGSSCSSIEDANSCKGWERPVHFEYYEPDGSLAFKLNTGLRVRGSLSCIFPRKQVGIYARDKYGEDEINYQFFKGKYLGSFKRLILRPGAGDGIGNRYLGTLFRDEMIAALVTDRMDIDYAASQPSVVYLNGDYQGIHNIRERTKQHYLASNHGTNKDDLDILENLYNGGVYQGDALHYQQMLSFINSQDLTLPENYEYVKTQMDVDEFINYQIVELYIANYEWGNFNVQCWRPRTADGKWRWVLWDVEGSFNIYPDGRTGDDVNSFNYIEDPFLRHRELFDNLLSSDTFRDEFIHRFAAHLNTSFSSQRVNATIDSLQALIQPEIQRDIATWSGECQRDCGVTSPFCTIRTVSDWENNVERMREFARGRPRNVRRHMLQKFGLSGIVNLTLNTEGRGQGSLFINDVLVTDTTAPGFYYTNVPLRITAKPDVGSQFMGWQETSQDSCDITISLSGDSTLTAIFEPLQQSMIAQMIVESTTLRSSDSPYHAQGDVIIASEATLTVEAGVELLMPSEASLIVRGALHMKGSETSPVVLRSHDNTQWGGLYFENSSAPSSIEHTQILGATHGGDPLHQKAAISGLNAHISLQDVLLDVTALPIYVESSHLLIDNISIQTPIIYDDFINVRLGHAEIRNSTFRGGTEAIDVDIIDCDQVESAYIIGNKFYNVNGDAIDFGDGSRGAVIQNNQIFGCLDKGISIGENTHATIERNLILDCLEGIAIKDSSYAILNQNTLYGNETAIACYEKTLTLGGATAFVVNTIMANSTEQAYRLDPLSSLQFNHSLSNTQLLPGVQNIYAEPGFTNLMHTQFYLDEGSPGIDVGLDLYIHEGDTLINMGSQMFKGAAPDLGAFEHGFIYDSEGNRSGVVPSEVVLNQNYPNPFNALTTLDYSLPGVSRIKLTIYDIRGKEVLTLIDSEQHLGTHQVIWDGLDHQGFPVSTGIYFCQLESESSSQTIKMLLLK